MCIEAAVGQEDYSELAAPICKDCDRLRAECHNSTTEERLDRSWDLLDLHQVVKHPEWVMSWSMFYFEPEMLEERRQYLMQTLGM